MENVIVTGAAGFIGSHLSESLLKDDIPVTGIDEVNDYYDPARKRANLDALSRYPGFRLVESPIVDVDWPTLLDGTDVVFHLAAQAGVRASWGRSFSDYTRKNIEATQTILEAAKSSPFLRRLVYASTSSVYGDAEQFPTPETVSPSPVSPYGITKLAAERLCWLYLDNHDVPVTALRYFTVYGPRQRPDMAFHKFFRAARAGGPINIYGDGEQTRDFTFVADAVAATRLAATCDDARGKVFNIGGGSRVILNDVLNLIDSITGVAIERRYIERAAGDARHTSADTTLAETLLGYRPTVNLEDGLRAEWDWYTSDIG